MTEIFRLQLLLVGEPSARPADLVPALNQAGFRVDELAEGAEAGRWALEERYDAVLLCVATEGPEAAEQVLAFKNAAQGSDVPLVAVSTGQRPEVLADLLRAGADDALAAPIRPDELQARIARIIQLHQDLHDLRASLRQRELLFDIFQEVSASLRAEEIFQTLVRRVGQALRLSHCSFVLTQPGERHGRVVAVYENSAARDISVELDKYPELREALRTERPVVIENIKEHPLFASIRERWEAQSIEVNIRSAVALPVFVQGAPAGVFFLRTKHGDPDLTARDVALADTIAQAAAKVLENEERRAAIFRRQSGAGELDAMTGCASLDALDRRIKDEFERARRYRLRFCLVLLDLDRFREVNERLGTTAGDTILVEMGHLLQRELRSPDFVARYGGDEFALLLPETDARGSRNFVQRLRATVLKHTFATQDDGRPTFSAGIVSFPHPEVLRTEDLFTLANSALVRAKATADDHIAVAHASGA